MLKLSLALCTFSITGSVAGLFLTGVIPYVYGYNLLRPHNLLTSYLIQAFVGKYIQMCYRLLLSHSICDAQLQQQYKFVKDSHCLEEMSECHLLFPCITPKTRYKDFQSSYEV